MLYLRDRNFLHEALPITKAAGRILRHVFTMDTSNRITLAQLRQAVLQVDRMYPTSAELDLATEEVQDIADRAIKLRVAALESESDMDSYIASSRSRASFRELQRMDGPTLNNQSPSLPLPVMKLPPLLSPGSYLDLPVNGQLDSTAHRGHADPRLALAARQCLATPAMTAPFSDVTPDLSPDGFIQSIPSAVTSSAPITPETRAVSDAAVTSAIRSMDDLTLPAVAACEENIVSSALKLADPIPTKACQAADDFMSRVLHELREEGSDSE